MTWPGREDMIDQARRAFFTAYPSLTTADIPTITFDVMSWDNPFRLGT